MTHMESPSVIAKRLVLDVLMEHAGRPGPTQEAARAELTERVAVAVEVVRKVADALRRVARTLRLTVM